MREGRGHGALVTAWNSSFQPGERRQVTVEAGRQESLGSHWSGRRKTAPGPPNFLLQGADRAEGSWAARRIPPGGPGCWARQGTAQPAGQVFGGRPRRGLLRPPGPAAGPRPAWAGRAARSAPGRAPRSPPAAPLAAKPRPRPQPAVSAQPTPPAASAREGEGEARSE